MVWLDSARTMQHILPKFWEGDLQMKSTAKQTKAGTDLKRREFLKRAGKTATAAAVTTVVVASAKPKEAKALYFPAFPDFPGFPSMPGSNPQ